MAEVESVRRRGDARRARRAGAARRGRTPLVSLGLPVYNGEKHVEAALRSACAQDYPNLEIIISDNASADGTEDICRRWARRDRRIRYLRQERNIGMFQNFVAVARPARGEYFKWMAHDDVLDAGCVSTLLRHLKEAPTATVATCHTPRYISRDGQALALKDLPRAPAPVEATFRLSRVERLHYALGPRRPSWLFYGLFRADAFRSALSMFERGVHSMRWEVFVECWALDQGDVAVCNRPLFTYRMGGTHAWMRGGLRLSQLLRSLRTEALVLPRAVDFGSLSGRERAVVVGIMWRHLYDALRRSYWPHAEARLRRQVRELRSNLGLARGGVSS